MSWIGLLLIGLSISDLVFSVRRVKVVPEVVGAMSLVLLGLLSGLTSEPDVVALLLMAGAVLAWGQTVTLGFARGQAWLPLVVLAVSLVVVVAFSGQADPAGGWLRDWLRDSPVPVLQELTPDRALVLLGVLLLQMSTGNVIVRLLLLATGTTNPTRHGDSGRGSAGLKGGRLLGPLERLFIVGLGLAGQVTAAGIVIAAKGLLRFPELQAARDDRDGSGPHRPGIHEVTEYFLVGSFVSWLVALASLVLLAT